MAFGEGVCDECVHVRCSSLLSKHGPKCAVHTPGFGGGAHLLFLKALFFLQVALAPLIVL